MSQRRRSCLSASILVLAFALPAALRAAPPPPQGPGVVIPANQREFPCTSGFFRPVGVGPFRYQYVIDRAEAASSQPVLVLSVQARSTHLLSSSAGVMDVEIGLSDSPSSHTLPSATFATNRGPSHFASFTRKNVNVPASQALANGPRPFNAVFPLDSPFTWGTGADLCLEVACYGGSGFAPSSFQSCQIVSSPIGDSAQLQQPSCFTSQLVNGQRRAPRLSFSQAPTQGFLLVLTVDSVLPTTPVLFWLSASGSSWNGVPLPFDLAPVGAPGCLLFSGILTAFSATSVPDPINLGAATLSLGTIPVDPALDGALVHAGALARDPAANAFGATFSHGQVALVGPRTVPMSQVSAEDVTSATGAQRLGFGTVWFLGR